ncbi:MAG: hypothetical protein ACM3SQ_14385 [Betaproteobacteria bacterium]
MIIPSRGRALPAALAAVALVGGALVAWHYHRLGLTLSHYDARGHLVVARRIFDSLTPGWEQIGAVWLPLPHLLNMLPVQIDLFYRTGASGVAISIAAFALAAGALAWIARELTGSEVAAVVAAAVFALNPNTLYLQSTPMTEPLLLGLDALAVALLLAWLDGRRVATSAVGWSFALACLTRYEAWPVMVCALTAAAWALWRRGDPLPQAVRRVGAIAAYPGLAIAGFCAFSRVVIGQWFVASGFFVPENKALGKPILAAAEIWWGTHALSGSVMLALGAAGLAALAARALLRRHATALVALSFAATAAAPWVAFIKGHPFRIRYMVPLVAAEAVGAGVILGLVLTAVARWRPGPRATALSTAVALLFPVGAAIELKPLDRHAPMVVEAQWDQPNRPVRARVTAYLAAHYDGTTIMASMGALGHYMQDTSSAGFRISDFLQEGNGDLWRAALRDPRPFVGWILIEEKAEGGDMLSRLARKDPRFLDGFSRVAGGAGLALYRRNTPGQWGDTPHEGM